MAFMHLS